MQRREFGSAGGKGGSGIGSQADLDAAEANFRVSEGRYQDAIEEVRNREGVLMQRRTELELAKQALSETVNLNAPPETSGCLTTE